METYILKKNGRVLLIRPLEVRNGTLWTKTKKGMIPLLNKDGCDIALIEKAMATGKYDGLPASAFWRPGDQNAGGGAAYTQGEIDEMERRERVEKLYTRAFGVSKNGDYYIEADVRDALPESGKVVFHGIAFDASGSGKSYQAGDWKVRRIYLKNPSAENPSPEDALFWAGKANRAAESYRYKFNKMMDDEYNDGLNPPSSLERNRFTELSALAQNPLAPTLAKIKDIITREGAGGVCYYAAQYARKALMAYEAGEHDIQKLQAIMSEVEKDKGYIEATWNL
jgi:hypothetical protein